VSKAASWFIILAVTSYTCLAPLSTSIQPLSVQPPCPVVQSRSTVLQSTYHGFHCCSYHMCLRRQSRTSYSATITAADNYGTLWVLMLWRGRTAVHVPRMRTTLLSSQNMYRFSWGNDPMRTSFIAVQKFLLTLFSSC